jgi:hypothetical protein
VEVEVVDEVVDVDDEEVDVLEVDVVETEVVEVVVSTPASTPTPLNLAFKVPILV